MKKNQLWNGLQNKFQSLLPISVAKMNSKVHSPLPKESYPLCVVREATHEQRIWSTCSAFPALSWLLLSFLEHYQNPVSSLTAFLKERLNEESWWEKRKQEMWKVSGTMCSNSSPSSWSENSWTLTGRPTAPRTSKRCFLWHQSIYFPFPDELMSSK